MNNIASIVLFIFFSFSAAAQHVVTGKVVSASNGEPLYGVTITIRHTTIILHTNAEGAFSYKQKNKTDTLVFSFVGYDSKTLLVDVGNAKSLLVRLQPDEHTLKEVTIVSSGYQNLPKERATGSFNLINRDLLNQQVGPTVLSRLEAVANGLYVDHGTTSATGGQLMVRGLSTIRGPKEPLIVLDNFPYEGSLDNLNPNDVESITVLKDAAATSIWGARAGNGVIVITTRKGIFNQPLTVELNVNSTVIQKQDLHYLRRISSAEAIGVEEFLYNKGKYATDLNSSSKPGLTPIVELLIKKDKGTITQAEYDAAKAQYNGIDIRDQYDRFVYENGLNQQYALNVRGGAAQHAWNLSAGHDRNSSTLSEKYNRYNLRFQHTYRPVKNLELNAGLYYTQSESTSGKPGYGTIISRTQLYPYAQLADEDGNALPIMKNYRSSYLDTAGHGKLLDWSYYPLEDYKHAVTTQTINDIVINGGINYRLFKGFSADFKYQYEREQTRGRSLYDEQSYFARNLVNSFTQLPSSGAIINKIPKGGILDLSNALLAAYNLRGQLNYSNTWGKHEVSAIAGAERRDSKTTSDQNRIYGYNDNILTYGNVDYLTQFPNYISGNLNYIPQNSGLSEIVTRVVSAYANGSYSYDGRYTVSLSGRRDASNLFGLKTNDKWTPLWSAGLSWDLSEEGFYGLADLPYLRLRATYGFSGNVNPSMTAVTTITYQGIGADTPSPIARFLNYYNPELSWERSRMINIGADFSLKKGRLNGSIEYFTKRGIDLYGNAQIDYTGGVGAVILKNAASSKGKGFDIELNSMNVNVNNFKWNTNLNASFYHDEVIEYYLSTQQASNFVGSSSSISGIVGRPVFSIFSYKWAGLDPATGNPRGYFNGELSTDYGKLTGSATTYNDLKYHGSAMPLYYGSLGNTFSYKGLSLTARLSYKLGYYFRRTSLSYGALFTNGTDHAEFSQRWQKPGDELTTNVPSMIYPNSSSRDAFYNFSEITVEKADHIRLQYINLAYELTKEKFGFLPFKSMSLSVNAANLGLLWAANNYKLDPDYQSSGALKPSKTFSLGLRANLN